MERQLPARVFRNFRLPCETKSAIFQGTLTPFALFPDCSKSLPGKMLLIQRVWGPSVRRTILQRKKINCFKDFLSQQLRQPIFDKEQIFVFFYVTFHSAPFGLGEYL